MLERDAFDEFHDEHRFVGIAGIDRRRRNAFLAAHAAGETQEIVTLYREVDFFAHRTVEFIDHGDDIDARQDRRTGQIQQVGSAAHKLDVALHVLFDVVAPDLYRDRGAVFGKMGLVHLGDRGRPERLFVEIGEHAHAIVSVDRLEPFDHVFERLGRGGAAQRLQRVAVFLRKHVRARGKDLAQLDERGTELFEQRDEFFRGQAARHLGAAQDFRDFTQTGGRRGVFQAVANKLHEILRTCHEHPLPLIRGFARPHCSAGP